MAHELTTQVGIVGAGPAGLLLSHLLHLRGHRLGRAREPRPRLRRAPRARRRARAGHASTCCDEAGVGERLHREGLRPPRHRAALRRPRPPHRLAELTGGRSIIVYGQQEVVKDLIAARLAAGGDDPVRRRPTSTLHDFDSSAPSIRFTHDGERTRARLRLRRRLRRLPRRLPAVDSRRRAVTCSSACTRSRGSASSPRRRRRTRS